MIDAANMVAGLKVKAEGLGTLTLVEPAGRCSHTFEAPVEVEVEPGRFEWVQHVPPGPPERWSALNEKGEMRIVDCHLCELA